MKLGKILGTALPLAAMFIPGVNVALAGAMGAAGLGALANPLTMGAITGGLGAALRKDNILKGAAMGGLGGGLGAAFKAGNLAGAINPIATGAQGLSAAQVAALPAGLPDAASSLPFVSGAPSMAGGFDPTEMGAYLQGGGNAAAKSASMFSGKSILPLLGLGGLALAGGMGAPRYEEEEEENRNPNAGKEYQPTRPIFAPPPGYQHGGPQGEWMFFNPEDTKGAYRYKDGGAVVREPNTPIYDPAMFAGLFNRPVIRPPSANIQTAQAPAANPVTTSRPAPPPTPGPGQGGGFEIESLYAPGQGYFMGAEQFSQGGYVQGAGDGQSDSIPAMINGEEPALLSDGEYVIPAMTVAMLGNGSNKAGAKKLDAFVRGINAQAE